MCNLLSGRVHELVPKQIALNNPERMASLIAYPMWYLARATAPLVWILSASTSSLMRLLPIQPSSGPPVTEAELQIMMEQGAESGVFEPIEEEIVEQLFRVGDQRVNDLMVDRTEIAWLDLDDDIDDLTTKVENGGHSRYPVARGDLDNLVGLVFVKDLLAQCLSGQGPDLEVILKSPLLVPSGLPVYQVLEHFKQARAQIAFVVDEHGGIEGLVTFNHLLEAIVGDVPETGDPEDPTAVRRADGSWLIDGKLPIDTFKQLFDIRALPQETENYYQTVGGFVMTYLKRVPNTGDTFEWAGLIFEVVDMDWRRIDKVLVSPVVPENK